LSTKRGRWRIAATAIAAAVAMALTGCGTGSGNPTGAAGGEHTYIEAIAQDPNGFNPNFAGGPIPVRFGFMILGTLVEMDDQYQVSPGIVDSWDFSEDGLTVTLHLRNDVKWHDGEPFTSADVVFDFQEIFPLQGQFGKPLAANVDSIEAPDDYTVVIKQKAPYGPFLESLSQLAVVPKHIYEGTDYATNPANMAPIGTGPMKFESFEPGAQVVLVKNPDWWGGDAAVDRAVFPVMTDPAARALALQNGEIDSAILDPSAHDQIATNSDLELMTKGFFRQAVTVTFNAQLPELSSPELRALVFSAIDRNAITEKALNGLGDPATSFFPDTMSWAKADDVDFDKTFPRDVDAINQGLDAAGYPKGSDGTRFTLDVRYIESLSDVAAAAEVIKSSLADVGIGVNLVGSADPVWQDAVYTQHDFGLALLRSTVSADPSMGITRWLTTNPDGVTKLVNGSGVSDPALDAAAEAALDTADRTERAAQFKIVQERAEALIFWAPLSWSNGANPTVNIARWSHIADGTGQTNNPPWATMEWIGG